MTAAPAKPTWDDLKDLLRWFATAFGAPREIWEDQVAARPLGLTMRGWLLALEAIARALLVLMAAELPKPEAVLVRGVKRAEKREAVPSAEESEPDADADSDRWLGVSFLLTPPKRPEQSGPWSEPRFEPRRFLDVRRLALRLEAVIRVAENPQRYAVRMSRRLSAEPKRIARVLRWPKPPGCRCFPEDDVARAQGHAWFAAETFTVNTG